jgi:hypothetical protein
VPVRHTQSALARTLGCGRHTSAQGVADQPVIGPFQARNQTVLPRPHIPRCIVAGRCRECEISHARPDRGARGPVNGSAQWTMKRDRC